MGKLDQKEGVVMKIAEDNIRGGNPLGPSGAINDALTTDSIIRIARSVKPSYHKLVSKIVYPEMELSGPSEYDLSKVEQLWPCGDQKHGDVVEGNIIHEHLRETGVIAACLTLKDGLAIQAKGIALFRKLFADKVVLLFGSVAQVDDSLLPDTSGNPDFKWGLFVPYLADSYGEVKLDWDWLDNNYSSTRHIVLAHPSIK